MADHARRALVVTVASLALWIGLAGVAAAHDCSSPRDCEQTAGYNAVIALTGGILAIGAGLIGVYVGTSAGVIPAAVTPPGAVPVMPPPPGPRFDPVSGEPLIEWRPGAYGADPSGNPGKPGDIWWGGKWTDASRMPGLLQQAQEDADAAAIMHQQFVEFTDKVRGQRDPALIEIENRIKASQQRLIEIKKASEEEQKRIIRDYMKVTQQQSEYWDAAWKRWDSRSKVAGYVGTAADTGVSIIGNYTGPAGKIVSAAYDFSKRTGAGIAGGEDWKTAATQGLVDAGTGYVVGEASGALGKKLGIPEPPDLSKSEVAVNTFMKSTGSGQIIVSKGTVQVIADKVVQPWAGSGVKSFVVGKGVEYLPAQGLKAVGVKFDAPYSE